MAPAYKFTYFNSRGISEGCRYLLLYGGIDFEEVRIQKEDWPPIKEKFPFGILPVLEHNGKRVCQSIAIARYLGRIVRLAGNDDWENLEIDSVVDTITDFRKKTAPSRAEQDPEKKKKLMVEAIHETVPYYLTRLEAQAQKNNGYLAVGRLTWADLYLMGFAMNLDNYVGENFFKNYPNLKSLREKVEALPGIKEWIEVRPITEF